MLRNTLAHLGGRGFVSAAGLIVTTIITAHLGAAAMGIFGIYMLLQNTAGILDGGMSITLNRVMAVGTLGETKDQKHLQLFRTYEVMNGCMGLLMMVISILLLPWLVNQWGDQHTVQFNLSWISLFFAAALGLRFMQMLYQNALFGGNQHYSANLVIASFAILRSIAMVVALLLFHGTLVTVFIILMISNGLEIIGLMASARAHGLWKLRVLPRWHLLKEYAHVMAPLSGYGIIGLILSQLDRVIVGHFVTLEQFGAYSLIASYAGGITALAYAPTNVFFPAITQAVHQKDVAAAKLAVKNAQQMILALTFPAGIWAMFYGADIGHVIFNNPDVQAMSLHLWVPLFLNCCVSVLGLIPFKILLANHRAQDIFKSNLVMLVIYPILMSIGLLWKGYPDGIYALPIMSGALLVLLLRYMGHLGDVQKRFIHEILVRSFSTGVGFAIFMAVAHLIPIPTGLPRILTALCVGAPAVISVTAYGFWVIVRPRFFPSAVKKV